MEDSSADYIGKLQSAVQDKLVFIENEAVPILTDAISEFRTTLETFTATLINAGLLPEDKYGGISEPHELNLPPDDPFNDDTKFEEMSFRLSEYLRRLDFLENNYNLTPDSLTLDRTAELLNFFRFINWERFSPAASSPNERLLTEIELSVQNSDDSLVRGIIRDNRKKLAETGRMILCAIEDIQTYLRENYKLEIRNRVLPATVIDPELAAGRPDEVLLIIRKEYRNEMGENPFYGDLVKEIISEDYSSESNIRRAETLQRILHNNTFKITEEVEADFEDTEASNIGLLFEGFRLLSAAGPSLLQIADKLTHNSDIIENAKPSLLRRIIMFLTGRKLRKPDRIYNVIVFNAENETGSRLKIDLDRFTAELTKEANYVLGAGSPGSSTRLELEQTDEPSILDQLEKHLKKIYRFQSVLPAIDKHLKDRADNSMRGMMNGIKLDLNDIQSCLSKANKRRLEYKAQEAL